MNYKDFYTVLLLEGRNTDLAKQKLIKAGKGDVYNTLLSIDKSKNNKHLPKLVDYYIEIEDFDALKGYYDRFVQNTSLNTKDINMFKTFKDFENVVDSTVTKVSKVLGEVDVKPIYEDSKIKVFHGDSKEACMKLSNGYTFCIGRRDSSNMYNSYRYNAETTFYFIRFKDKNADTDENGKYYDDEHYIVIQALTNGSYFITMANNEMGDKDITSEEIVETYPELRVLFTKNIIKPVEHTEKEKHVKSNVRGKEFSEMRSVDDQISWVELNPGRDISNFDFTSDHLSDEVRKVIIENNSSRDLNDHQLNFLKSKRPKLFERYVSIKSRNLLIKQKNNIEPTRHEYWLASNKDVDTFIKNSKTLSDILDLMIHRKMRGGVQMIKSFLNFAPENVASVYDIISKSLVYVYGQDDVRFVQDINTIKNDISDDVKYQICDTLFSARINRDSMNRAKTIDIIDSDILTSGINRFSYEDIKSTFYITADRKHIDYLKKFLDKITHFSENLIYNLNTFFVAKVKKESDAFFEEVFSKLIERAGPMMSQASVYHCIFTLQHVGLYEKFLPILRKYINQDIISTAEKIIDDEKNKNPTPIWEAKYKDFYEHLNESKSMNANSLEYEFDDYGMENQPIKNIDELHTFLDTLKIRYKDIKIPLDESDYVVTDSVVIEFDTNPATKYPFTFHEKGRFVYDVNIDNLWIKLEEKFNIEFWKSPSYLYHATQDEYVDEIKINGLRTGSGTGINNRGESGVFTVDDYEVLLMGSYGNNIFQIDCASMKKDGYTPHVGREPDIVEGEIRSMISNFIDYREYSPDESDGQWDQTVIVKGKIHPKYLKLIEK